MSFTTEQSPVKASLFVNCKLKMNFWNSNLCVTSTYLRANLLQVDKLYDEKDDDFDPRERDEEIARMREHVVSEVEKLQ